MPLMWDISDENEGNSMRSKLCAFLYLACISLASNVTFASDWKTLGGGEALGDCAGYNKGCAEVVKTRYGELSIRTSGEDAFSVQANGSEVKKLEGYSLTIQEIHPIGKMDVALLALNSGGMACPMQLYVVQIADGLVVTSDAFGTCSDYYRAHVKGGSLTVVMPEYFNPMHLGDLSEKQRVRLEKESVEAFEWSDSKLSKKPTKHKR